MFSWFSSKPGEVKRKFAWKRGHPKLSDAFHYFNAPPTSLPSTVDLRPTLPPVYDQGELGSCVANATAFAVQYDLMTNNYTSSAPTTSDATPATPTPTAPATPATTPAPAATTPAPAAKKDSAVDASNKSRLFIYYNARVIDGTVSVDAGTSIHSAVQALETQGVPDEATWPYYPNYFATQPSSAAYKQGTQFKADTFQTKYLRQNIVQIKSALASNMVVVCGISVYASFMNAKEGMIPVPQPGEELLGGHAISLVGYDDSKQAFIMRNSWGASWQLGGYAYLPYQYLADPRLADEFCTIRKMVITAPTTVPTMTKKP